MTNETFKSFLDMIKYMAILTIPKKLIEDDDLVVIPRKEYEEFVKLRKIMKSFKIFTPTFAQKKDLKKAREDYKKGKYLTIDELKHKLEIKD